MAEFKKDLSKELNREILLWFFDLWNFDFLKPIEMVSMTSIYVYLAMKQLIIETIRNSEHWPVYLLGISILTKNQYTSNYT